MPPKGLLGRNSNAFMINKNIFKLLKLSQVQFLSAVTTCMYIFIYEGRVFLAINARYPCLKVK